MQRGTSQLSRLETPSRRQRRKISLSFPHLTSRRWVTLLIFLVLLINGAEAFDRKRRTEWVGDRRKSTAMNEFGAQSVRDNNRNKRRIFRAIEGVRMITVLRGGNAMLGPLDRKARSAVLFLGWIVSFQALSTAIVSHRDSLLEVCRFDGTLF